MQTISSMNSARAPRRIAAISIGILSVLMLASCGGGGSTDPNATAQSADEATKTIQGVSGSTTVPGTWTGRAPKMEVINGITVPPEPAPTINNATLAGVDVNNNGVRDDVERMIARTATQKEFNATIDYASRNNYAIANSASSKTRADALNMIKKISCFDAQDINPEKYRRINGKSITSIIYNTPERMSALSAFSSLIGGYSAEEVVCD